MNSADVVIIGAGIMGSAIGLRLRQRGLSVILVERGIPGAEASSAAAGILAPQVEAEGPGPFLDLLLSSRALYPAWVEEITALTGIDLGYRREGTLLLGPPEGGPDPHEAVSALRARKDWQTRAGLRVRWLDAAELQAAEPALRRCAGALHFPDDHQIVAPRLSQALSQAAAQAGARFVIGHVERVLHDGVRVYGVAVEGEELRCGAVVVAAGSWSGLVEGTGLPPRAVRPMRGQMIELCTRPPVLRHVVFGHTQTPLGDVGGYLVPRRDGRVVVGSTMELVGFRKEVTVTGLTRLLGLVGGLAPGLRDAEVGPTWAGFRPYTGDTLPLLGAAGLAGLFLCTGHFRNGILLMPISAEALCAEITGTWSPGVSAPDLRPFSPTRLGGTMDRGSI